MPEMHLRQSGFTFSACGPFTKSKERIQKFKEAGYSRYIYETEPNKACLQHDMTCRVFKDLPRRSASDKVLRDKALNIAKNRIKEVLIQCFITFSIRSLLLVVLNMKLCQTSVLWT